MRAQSMTAKREQTLGANINCRKRQTSTGGAKIWRSSIARVADIRRGEHQQRL